MFDVAIIGAGVVGGMIARELSQYQLSVCILDKENDVSLGASRANSAIVHAGFDAKEGSLKAKFNVQGAEMMPKVCEELGVFGAGLVILMFIYLLYRLYCVTQQADDLFGRMLAIGVFGHVALQVILKLKFEKLCFR